MRKNIIVIGDLVIDHAIFVEERRRTRENEDKVIRRQDTAGGAANTARILAVLNSGKTYLWGVIGTSHWGNFRSILEMSHLLDGALTNVELRGIRDETDAKMNTITRLIVKHGGKQHRKHRYDDVDHVHVSDTKRKTVLHHLRRIVEDKGGLHAIIINDFDKKCLTKENIEDIYEFAAKHKVPLFVDPKRDGEKYLGIEGAAILPNLEEWCWLVGEKVAEIDNWLNGLDETTTLERMAQKSLRHLSNFKYHIIKCGRLGAVIIGPHPKLPHYCAVYRVPPAFVNELAIVADPLGCGDVMTGAFAFYYDKDRESMDMALEAFHRANIVVGCYREMPWHRMPRLESVEKRLKESTAQSESFEIKAMVSKAIAYLPKELKVSLATQVSDDVPGVYLDKMRETDYTESLNRLAQEVAKNYGWPAPKETIKNIIFGAPSGTGKTTILGGLELALKDTPGIRVVNINRNNLYKEEVLTSLDTNNAQELRAKIANLVSITEPISEECLILLIIDEAYDKLLEGKSGKLFQNFLQAANLAGIRLLLADSEFYKSETLQNMRQDIYNRCVNPPHILPPLTEHPMDIPYVLFGALLKYAEGLGNHHPIKVENHVVLELIESVLEAPDGTPRDNLRKLKEAYRRAAEGMRQVTIKFTHWESVVGQHRMVASTLPVEFYTISR